jgi:hypothetical protein
VRRLPLLQFGYGSSATVTGGRTDSIGTDCRRDQKNTNHVSHLRRTSPRVRVNGSDTTATLMARLKQDRADKS